MDFPVNLSSPNKTFHPKLDCICCIFFVMIQCFITVGQTLMPLGIVVVETLNVFDVFIKDFWIHLYGDNYWKTHCSWILLVYFID